MPREDHIADARLAGAIMDAGSPGEAKRLIERYRVRTWNAAIEAVAVLFCEEDAAFIRGLKKPREGA